MLLRHNADDLAFLRVHLELELLFQISLAQFQQSLGHSFTFREYDDIIRIADNFPFIYLPHLHDTIWAVLDFAL